MTAASHLGLRAATVKHISDTEVKIQYDYIIVQDLLEWSLPGKTSGSSSPHPAAGPPWTWTGEQIVVVNQTSILKCIFYS